MDAKDFIAIYEEKTKRIVACIDLNHGTSILGKGLVMKEYHGTEPVLVEKKNCICLSEDSFIVKM